MEETKQFVARKDFSIVCFRGSRIESVNVRRGRGRIVRAAAEWAESLKGSLEAKVAT